MEFYPVTHPIISNGLAGNIPSGTGNSAASLEDATTPSRPKDRVSLSPEGKEYASQSKSSAFTDTHRTGRDSENLNQQELEELQQLKRRDTEVRTHEQAHLSAAGQYARGSASFTYQKGPDGGSYAIGGEVGIDIAKESTPEATISKMQTIKRAALAPANPSGEDKRIAAQANAKEAQARQEMLQKQQDELLQGESTASPLSKSQVAQDGNHATTPASTYGSLKTQIAAYSKMAGL